MHVALNVYCYSITTSTEQNLVLKLIPTKLIEFQLKVFHYVFGQYLSKLLFKVSKKTYLSGKLISPSFVVTQLLEDCKENDFQGN